MAAQKDKVMSRSMWFLHGFF